MNKLLIACLLGSSLSLGVQANEEHMSHPPAMQSATDLNQGEVRKVDVQNRKLTLRHGPIAVMAMPPMTMVFGVIEGVSLQGLAAGDKVEFVVEQRNGEFVVTRLQKAP